MNPKYLEIYKSNNVYPQVNNTFPNFEIYNLREPILSNNERVVNKDTPLKAPVERKKGKSRLVDLPSFSSFVKAYANKQGIAYKEAIKSQEVKEAYRAFRGSNNLEVSVLNPNPMNLKLAYPKEASNTYLDKRFNVQPQYAPVSFGPSDAFLQRTSVKFQAYENLKNATKEIATDFINNLNSAKSKEIDRFKGSVNKILPLGEEMQAKLFKEIDASNKGIFAYSVFPDLIAKFAFEEFSDKQNRELIYTPLSNRSQVISLSYLQNVKVQIVDDIPNLEKVDSVYANFGGLFDSNFDLLIKLYENSANISRPFKFYFVDSRKLDNLQDFYRTMERNNLLDLINRVAGITDGDDITDIEKYLKTGKDESLLRSSSKVQLLQTDILSDLSRTNLALLQEQRRQPQVKQEVQKPEEVPTTTVIDVTAIENIKAQIRQVDASIANELRQKKEDRIMYFSTEIVYGTILLDEGDLITNKRTLKNISKIYEVTEEQKSFSDAKINVVADSTIKDGKITYNAEKLKVIFPAPDNVNRYNVASVRLRDAAITQEKYDYLTRPIPDSNGLDGPSLLDIQIERFGKSESLQRQREQLEVQLALLEAADIQTRKTEIKGQGLNLKGGSFESALSDFNQKVGIASIENLGKSGNDYVYRLNIN
jgi:hypothetical protein